MSRPQNEETARTRGEGDSEGAGRVAGQTNASVLIPAVAIAVLAVAQVATWGTREYSHDDFYFAYVSWLQSAHVVPGAQTQPGTFTALADLLWPLFRLFPESLLPLDISRWLMLGVAASLGCAVYVVSRRLGASVAWALAATSLALWQPDVARRIADIRTDPIAAALLLAAGAILLLRPGLRRAVIAGVVSGAAVGISSKTVAIAPLLAVLVLHAGPSRLRRAAALAFGALCGLVLVSIPRLLERGLGLFLSSWKGWASVAASAPPERSDRLLLRWLEQSPFSMVLLGIAVTAALALLFLGRAGSKPGNEAMVLPAVWASLVVAAWVSFSLLNPYLYPYNFVILIPFSAPLLASLPVLISRRATPLAETLVLGAAVCLPLWEGHTVIGELSRSSNSTQRNVAEWVWRATGPDERVFDWLGLPFGRRSTYHWWTFSGLRENYRSGREYSVRDELRAAGVSVVIGNYRLAWLTPEDATFLRTEFVPLDHCILVAGRVLTDAQLTGGLRFETWLPGPYAVFPPAARERVTIDGHPASGSILLERGEHAIQGEAPVPRFVMLVYLPGRRMSAPPLPCPVGKPLFGGF